jgi:hypothetical protein
MINCMILNGGILVNASAKELSLDDVTLTIRDHVSVQRWESSFSLEM